MKLTKRQLLGIVLLMAGIAGGYFLDGFPLGFISGIFSATGVTLLLKWMPFKREKV